jgi:hypothetical protein
MKTMLFLILLVCASFMPVSRKPPQKRPVEISQSQLDLDCAKMEYRHNMADLTQGVVRYAEAVQKNNAE